MCIGLADLQFICPFLKVIIESRAESLSKVIFTSNLEPEMAYFSIF